MGLEAYISTEQLRKLRARHAAPSTSQPDNGRLSKRRKGSHELAGARMSGCHKEDQYAAGDVFVLDDDGGVLGNVPSRDMSGSERRRIHNILDDNDPRMLLQSCLQEEDISDDDDDGGGGALSEEGDELDVFRLTQRVPPSSADHHEIDNVATHDDSGEGQEEHGMIELRFVDQNRHEFSIRALSESTFKYPCSKFVEHAQEHGWITNGSNDIKKYVFDGDIVDIEKHTPSDFGMEDGDTVDVHY